MSADNGENGQRGANRVGPTRSLPRSRRASRPFGNLVANEVASEGGGALLPASATRRMGVSGQSRGVVRVAAASGADAAEGLCKPPLDLEPPLCRDIL